MGKIPQGILGGVSGKVGGIVGTSWKGINVIKTKPLTVANPRTAGQIAQRSKFGYATKFASNILATGIKPLWDRFSSRMSGYNAFIKNNVAIFDDVTPSDPSALIFSKGKMGATEITSVAPDVDGIQLVVSWVSGAGQGYKLGTDQAYILKFKPGNELAESIPNAAIRDDQSAVIPLNDVLVSGEEFHFYLAFKRADGTVVSDSSYFHYVHQ